VEFEFFSIFVPFGDGIAIQHKTSVPCLNQYITG
jgi:hypothetical protein